jgi:hypothetical protein
MRENKSNGNLAGWLCILLIVGLVYVGISQVVYRFRHPEQTSTQLFLNTFEALQWK